MRSAVVALSGLAALAACGPYPAGYTPGGYAYEAPESYAAPSPIYDGGYAPYYPAPGVGAVVIEDSLGYRGYRGERYREDDDRDRYRRDRPRDAERFYREQPRTAPAYARPAAPPSIRPGTAPVYVQPSAPPSIRPGAAPAFVPPPAPPPQRDPSRPPGYTPNPVPEGGRG